MSNILVIEDEESMGEFMVTMLQTQGYRVDLASDGIEGLDLYHTAHHDLVITDMRMPNMEGVEVCANLMNLQPNPPIIAMSAGQPDYLKSAVDLGVKYTFEKPFDIGDFLNSVSEALQRETTPA